MDEKKPVVELNIYQKIALIRESVGSLVKEYKENLKYKYVTGAQILEKMQPKMNELKVLLIPDLADEAEHTEVSGVYPGGKAWTGYQYKNKMTYTWVNADKPDDRITVSWDLIGIQDDPAKAFGSALTYASRYFLLNFLGLPSDELDPDNKKQDKKQADKKPAPKLIQKDQIAIFQTQYPGELWVKFLEKNELKKIEDMPYEKAKEKIDNLTKTAEALRAKKEAENADAK